MKSFLSKYSWENAFYLLSAYITWREQFLIDLQAGLVAQADWMFPFNFAAPANESQYSLIGWLVPVLFLVLALVRWRPAPLASVAIWAAWLSLINSFGTVQNSKHGYFFAAVGIAIAWLVRSRDRALEYAIAGAVSIYACSGMWKLRILFGKDDIVYSAAMNMPEHIASGLVEYYRPNAVVFLEMFSNHYYFSALTWVMTGLLQMIVPLLALIVPAWRVPLLLLLIGFHFAVQILVGPNFYQQSLLLGLFIVVILWRRFGEMRAAAV